MTVTSLSDSKSLMSRNGSGYQLVCHHKFMQL